MTDSALLMIQAESVGALLSTFPVVVNNPWGAVVFVDNEIPPPEALRTRGNYNVTLQYRWESPPFTDSTAIGTATIIVDVSDLPPRLLDPELSSVDPVCGGGAKIRLSSTKSMEQSESYYRIDKAPSFGMLYQVRNPTFYCILLTDELLRDDDQ